MLFDTHCHLNDDTLFADLDSVIERAKEAEVGNILCVGYDKASSERALQIAEQYDFVFAAIGIHPTNSKESTEEDYVWLESHLRDPKVVAVGEIGLDYYWDATYKEHQQVVFRRQIHLAKQYQLPISIHMRDATQDTLEILQSEQSPDLKGIMHCYGGSAEMAPRFIEAGMMISLGGPVTFKNAKVPKEVAKTVPLESLLIETDAPYLAPHPYRGKTNEPSLVRLVADEIALLRGLSTLEIEKITWQNALRLFQIH